MMRDLIRNAEKKTGKQPSPLTTIPTKEEWTALKKITDHSPTVSHDIPQ